MWESANSILPPLLQKFSVIYYLKSLCPIAVAPQLPAPLSLLAVNPDPISPAIAIFGLLLLATLVVLWAGARIRKMEISYSSD